MAILKRKRTWFALTLVLILGAGAAANLGTKSAIHAERERWRAAGLPTDSAELNQWYRRVPEESNAALVFIEAHRNLVMASPTNDPGQMSLPDIGQPLDPKYVEAAEQYLKKNRAVLELIYEAAELPEARYPIDLSAGFNALLPHLAQMKSLAQFLKHEAVYQSYKGNREEAVRAVRAGFALGRSLRNEPVLISELVRIACVAINLTALERVLSSFQLTGDELALLEKDIAQAEADGPAAMHRALIGERVGGVAFFGTSFQDFQALSAGGMGAPPPNAGQLLLGNSMFMLYKATGLRQRDTRIYVEVMDGYIASVTNDFPQAMRLSEQAEQRFVDRTQKGLGRMAIYSRMLIPALLKAVEKEARLVGNLRCARAALLVEKHRLENGVLPGDLEEAGAGSVRDTLNDEPLELRLEQPGYRIVSLAASKKFGTKTVPYVGTRVAR